MDANQDRENEVQISLNPDEVEQLKTLLAADEKVRNAFFRLPPHASRLYLTKDIVLISAKPKPNAFRRFMLWLFFGWRWQDGEQ